MTLHSEWNKSPYGLSDNCFHQKTYMQINKDSARSPQYLLKSALGSILGIKIDIGIVFLYYLLSFQNKSVKFSTVKGIAVSKTYTFTVLKPF